MKKFLQIFLKFYIENAHFNGYYICWKLSDSQYQHPFLSIWYQKEINQLKRIIRICLEVQGSDMDSLLYPKLKGEEAKQKRILFIQNLLIEYTYYG